MKLHSPLLTERVKKKMANVQEKLFPVSRGYVMNKLHRPIACVYIIKMLPVCSIKESL